MLTHSEAINEISTALAKAQASMDNAAKGNKNPAFGSKYADLASVRDAVNGPLSAAGIAYVQAPHVDADGVTVETRLMHTSGQWLACTVGARPKDYTPQSIGSCVTYLRRYGLMALAGIAPDDDDGNAASSTPPARPAPKAAPVAAPAPQPAPAPVKKWTDAQRAGFCADLGAAGLGYDLVADFCESINRPRPSAMEPADRSKLLAYLLTPEGKAKMNAYVNALENS